MQRFVPQPRPARRTLDFRIRHPHHLRGDPVCLLLVLISRLVDRQSGLYRDGRGRVQRYLTEIVAEDGKRGGRQVFLHIPCFDGRHPVYGLTRERATRSSPGRRRPFGRPRLLCESAHDVTPTVRSTVAGEFNEADWAGPGFRPRPARIVYLYRGSANPWVCQQMSVEQRSTVVRKFRTRSLRSFG
ncbi:hypothetical protein D3C87_1385680 [compost metagenome]